MIIAWQKTKDATLETINLVDYGVVDAGSQSNLQRLILTNNFYSTDPEYQDVSKAENVRITTKDSDGGFNLDLVQEQWISVNCEDLFQYKEDGSTGQPDFAEPNFFKVGSEEVMEEGNTVQKEVAAFVCASLTADHTGNTAPVSPTEGTLWRDTSNRFTAGDIFKRYKEDTSEWVEVNEISGKEWVNDNPEDNKENRIYMNFIATVPSSSLAGVRLFNFGRVA